MNETTIRAIVLTAVVALQNAGEIPDVEMTAFAVEQAPDGRSGDYATDAAVVLASALKASGRTADPHALAETIAAHVRETVAVVPAYEQVRGVDVTSSGTLILRLDSGSPPEAPQ